MKYFRLTILFLILTEIFSFCGFLYSDFNKMCFLAIILITIILSLKKMEYGIYILLAELFVGSFGYLFFYETGGISVSLRLGLFISVMSVWLAKVLTSKEHRLGFIKKLKNNKFIKYYFIFFAFLVWGVIWGILRKNGIDNVFFDANSYIYFALIFPFLDVIKNKDQIKIIIEILFASAIVISVKTLFLLFVFSHKMYYVMEFLYKWIRDYRLGEITEWQGGFYRVFSQSHIYVLIALFAVILLNTKQRESVVSAETHELTRIRTRKARMLILYVLFFSIVLVGLSRSFWVGGLMAGIVMIAILLFVIKYPIRKLIKFILSLILCGVASIIFIFMLVKFPYPKENIDFSISLFSSRASAITGESGASSRWNLLPVLTKATFKHPIIGSGFGSAVTYTSNDPRVRASSPTGDYTTYAFEWGYLDIIFKIGLAGMLAYLLLVWKILAKAYFYLKSEVCGNEAGFADRSPVSTSASSRGGRISTQNSRGVYLPKLVFWLIIGLIVILATSIFSPYMNHPLGIGYIMLATAILSVV
ncbi:hypothetical protein ACFL2L_01040 [Patescibacteria group bacterium]